MTTCLQPCRRRARCRDKRDVDRDGSVTLEFLLVVPVLLIVLLATVEFGMFFSNMQQVALAARLGAEAASEYATYPAGGPLVPSVVTDPIEQQLDSSGISPCKVILQHNVSGGETLTTPYGAGCPCGPPATLLPATASVRVTVYVPMTELAPNCLVPFGFNLTGYYAHCSTTFRYEL